MMKRFFRSKLVLSLIAFIIVGGIVAIPLSGTITRAHAASRSSHNIAYVTYDDSGFTGANVPSANIFSDAIVGGPAPTSSPTASVTYNGMTFTPLARAALSTATLASYDTLLLFEVCDIATSLTPSQHTAINAYLAAGNKILLYDSDRCAVGNGGVADYSWFTYPFATSSPGPQGASGTLTVVENSTLTQGLSSDPFNNDELGDANTATTSDPHWFAAAKTTNTLGNNGYFLAYARNTGLIIYDGADHWYTNGPTKSLTDLFLNELNQQYNPDNLPSTTPIAGTVNYVALGDSYSSGEGNPPFFTGTDGPNDFCHRSPQAYSQVLGKAYGLQPQFYACSGAVTDNVSNNKYRFGEKPQIQEPGVDKTAGLVTMTIGGNDAGFGDVLKTCIALRLVASTYNLYIGPVSKWLGFGVDPSCADYKAFVDSENANITNIRTPVESTYHTLLGGVSAHDTSIIVAGYPHLFPDSPHEQSCLDLLPFLTTADQQYFNIAGDRLDNVLKTAAGQAGVNFVDVRSNFKGHGMCGNGGTWINSIVTALGNGSGAVGAFHPNASGQAGGYATAFESYIKSATNRTPEGYPSNPTPLLTSSTATASVTATDAVQQLTVQPVTTGTSDCQGIYKAGQQLLVNGDGFAPGKIAHLYVRSPGLSPNGEQQVGQLTADSTGHVAGTISIPLAATGFTVKGSNAGLIFVDAIGSGPGGVHNDDVAMEGLASPGSNCGTSKHLPFVGFESPIANFPHVNKVEHGQPVTIEFSLTGVNAPINNILARDYPQSAPVSCSSPSPLTTGVPTQSINVNDPNLLSGEYKYVWKTNPSWRGCRELIVKLVDGSYHRAVFNFTK